MRLRFLTPVMLIALAAGCNSFLDVSPKSSIPSSSAISDAQSAEAALAGAYAALQSLNYYGEDFTLYGDASSDNAAHSGTFTWYADATAHTLRADNEGITSIWEGIWDAINRDNQILTQVPKITDPNLGATEKNEILGEAHFLRALSYHNLVKLWGGVPIVIAPPKSLSDAASVTRASVQDVYTQILTDLDSAQMEISNTSQTRQASLGAVLALRARVELYDQNWTAADSAAAAVEGMGYSLAPDFSSLFDPSGTDTPEDIFRLIFTPQQYNNVGYYYLTRNLGGRYEIKPTLSIEQAFDPSDTSSDPTDQAAYNPVDLRGQYSIGFDGSRVYGAKFRSSAGTENIHVIRFGEVLLIRAEALARLDSLAAAVAEYNQIRTRAGLQPQTLGVEVGTQSDVINQIVLERRRELAFEGDRWPDLVRLGIAATVLNIPTDQTLYPIPQRDMDVTPGLTQNPGY